MDKISRIAMFLEVVRHQSFAGAARHLGVTGPAISKQVQALEEQLGVKLLYRTTRQISLTEEGQIYSDRARKALEDLREAENQIQELKECPTGQLKINAPMSFGKQYLVSPIAAFAKQYPDVNMQIDFDDRQVDLIGEGYDVVIRIGHLPDSSFIARALAPCPIVLCASPDLIDSPMTHPKEVSNFPAIIYSAHGYTNEWRYQDPQGQVATAALKAQLTANNAEMMLGACLDGIGLALLPIFIASSYLQSGQLIHVLPEFQTYPKRGIYALMAGREHLSTRKRLFIDHLLAWSQSLPWQNPPE